MRSLHKPECDDGALAGTRGGEAGTADRSEFFNFVCGRYPSVEGLVGRRASRGWIMSASQGHATSEAQLQLLR